MTKDPSKLEIDEEGRLRCPRCDGIMRTYTQDDAPPDEFVAGCDCGFWCARGQAAQVHPEERDQEQGYVQACTAVLMERDWTPWLPPHDLPNVGPLERKPGQVWAWRAERDDPIVYRVIRDDDVEVLARPAFPKCKSCSMGVGTADDLHDTGGHAVLVQDVGQAEPTPPELLYGARPGQHVHAYLEENVPEGEAYWCTQCSGDDHHAVIRCDDCGHGWCAKMTAPVLRDVSSGAPMGKVKP